jgi:hypothetical protein
MHGPDAEPFQALRAKMETEWTPQMMKVLGVDRRSLPIIWDADFLYGPQTALGEDSYVLCEINVSSCFAIPEQASAAIARLTQARLCSARQAKRLLINMKYTIPEFRTILKRLQRRSRI